MVSLREEDFGLFTDKTTGKSTSVRKFVFTNQSKISIEVITYGATITSIKLPDSKGVIEDIVAGFSDLKGYQNPLNPYFGATIGRVANRIALGRINNDGQIIEVSKNRGNFHLHGGFVGFDKVLWEPYVNGTKLILSYHSSDSEEGYPGDLVVNVSFELTTTNQFLIQFKANTTKPTFVNLTNHSYFNLAGHSKGADEIYKHTICINADSYTETDSESIPTGNVLSVTDTVFDLQIPRVLGTVIDKVPNMPGFDNNFCITKGPEQGITFIARAIHPPSGRILEVYSDQPGVQFYTANFLPEDPKKFKGDKKDLQTLSGKQTNYYKHGAFCFETQVWPDAPNHKNFPSSKLCPGETYIHNLIYKFAVKD